MSYLMMKLRQSPTVTSLPSPLVVGTVRLPSIPHLPHKLGLKERNLNYLQNLVIHHFAPSLLCHEESHAIFKH